ncbi:MAG: type II toxin-antitoxin system RelE/ParE family toxin [Candidatus Cloacimonetes bacterium]|nr:type II toxin-antitoxin system RelE/ParE family toxin [Candidatus Cloacimonadota bacterium]
MESPWQQKIIESISRLSESPYPNNSKKLTNRPARRIRIGNYRIIYEIEEKALIILILVIGHRREVYRK